MNEPEPPVVSDGTLLGLLVLDGVLVGALGLVFPPLYLGGVPVPLGVLLSVLVNCGLFVLAFRVLTARRVSLRQVLPRVYVDGPFGSASEDVFKFEVAILVGAGIGVTPFASILKSIWYRLNYPQGKTRLRKVYFFWVIRDFGSFEWFRSLLMAIEAQDLDDHIEIHTYLTAKLKPDDAQNIMINDANAEQDAISGLRAPTNFGRPNWNAIFKCIRKIHTPSEAGVFFCGPKGLGSQLHIMCNQYSDPDFSFVWGKENF